MWSPTGKPAAPLGFADSLRERRRLVVRHPDCRRIHPRLKPWLSAVGVKNTNFGLYASAMINENNIFESLELSSFRPTNSGHIYNSLFDSIYT